MKKKEKNLLILAGIGLGAWWFFSQKKAPPIKPTPKANPATSMPAQYRSTAAVGSPYRDAVV